MNEKDYELTNIIEHAYKVFRNELDYYVKHKLKIKCYLRYMDDFIILVKDKYEAKYIDC